VISTGDKIRILLAPAHIVVGGALIAQFVRGPRVPTVLVLGVLLVAYGFYRVALVYRALKRRK
jgi:hypothetical protein